MKKTENQPIEGGQDFKGLEAFMIDVNTDGISDNDNYDADDIVIETGEEKETEDIDTSEKKETSQEEGGEKKTEEPKEESKEEPKEKVEENQSDSYYSKLATKFLEKGKWQDVELELEDGKKVKLSELDNIDEETFFAIEESQSNFTKEEIENNYIKKGDFDENKLKVIEILKNGGDIKDIFETPEEAQRPFEGIDLEDEKVQNTVFFNYLTQVQSLNPDDAKIVLKNHIDRGEIGDKVKQIVEGYQSNYDKRLSDKLEEVKKKNLERQEKDKEFTKKLEETYNNFNLDKKLAKKLASLGTKRNKEGDFELDAIYSEKMEKEDEAAELIYFLMDKEGYLKDKMAETKINTQNKNLRTIKIIKDKDKKSSGTSSKSQEGLEDFVVSVDE